MLRLNRLEGSVVAPKRPRGDKSSKIRGEKRSHILLDLAPVLWREVEKSRGSASEEQDLWAVLLTSALPITACSPSQPDCLIVVKEGSARSGLPPPPSIAAVG